MSNSAWESVVRKAIHNVITDLFGFMSSFIKMLRYLATDAQNIFRTVWLAVAIPLATAALKTQACRVRTYTTFNA